MYPAMPYRFYTQILDEDVDAIWAYMKTVEPVSNEVAEHDMSFPATVRMGLAVWKEINFEPGRFKPVSDRDETYNRGKYLVEGVAHCSACHSPRNLSMGVREEAAFTGAVIDDWYAPNIGSGPMSFIDDWSIEDLTEYLRTGQNRTNTKAVGKMSTVVHNSLSKLEEEDVVAMATYLKNMPEPEEQPEVVESTEASSAQPGDDRELVAGRAIYAENCLACHQPGGKGIDGRVPALAGTSVVTAREPNNAILLVLQGHEVDEESWGAMPAFGNLLHNEEIADVVNYIRTAWTTEGMMNAGTELVSELRAGAEIPEVDEQAAGLFCPVATGSLSEAVGGIEEARIKGGAQDVTVLESIVAEVRKVDEDAKQRDLITAISTRYCLVLADGDSLGNAELNSRVAEFSGKVAAAVAR